MHYYTKELSVFLSTVAQRRAGQSFEHETCLTALLLSIFPKPQHISSIEYISMSQKVMRLWKGYNNLERYENIRNLRWYKKSSKDYSLRTRNLVPKNLSSQKLSSNTLRFLLFLQVLQDLLNIQEMNVELWISFPSRPFEMTDPFERDFFMKKHSQATALK